MIRFAWLQSRTQTLVAGAGLVVMAIVVAITGRNLIDLYDTMIAPCAANGDCSQTTINGFLQNHKQLRGSLDMLVVVIPGFLGIFWGAPLVAREIETGTFRSAWTQSVTRTRWLGVKIGVVLVTTMVVSGLLSLMVTWWNKPFDRVGMNAFARFDARDIVPMGHAAFAFALGVTAGMLIRRTLPAMATVTVVFTATRVTMTHFVRPRLFAPLHMALPLDPNSTGLGRTSSGGTSLQPSAPNIPDAWIVSTELVDDSGQALTSEVVANACPRLGVDLPAGPTVRTKVPGAVKTALDDCVATISETYHKVVAYHPGRRYWAFQWYEFAIYVAAAAALAGICIWSVRRRRA